MMFAQEQLTPRDLFGGAIKLSLPARLGDVSTVRPVPDHQEVFTDPERDQSLLVEIVEFQEEISDDEAAQFFFRDLAELGGAPSCSLEAVLPLSSGELPLLPPGPRASLATGQQVLRKGSAAAQARSVQVLLANVRLPSRGSDLLLTLNTPLAAAGVDEGSQSLSEDAPQLFKQILRSFQIVDWTLFGEES